MYLSFEYVHPVFFAVPTVSQLGRSKLEISKINGLTFSLKVKVLSSTEVT